MRVTPVYKMDFTSLSPKKDFLSFVYSLEGRKALDVDILDWKRFIGLFFIVSFPLT